MGEAFLHGVGFCQHVQNKVQAIVTIIVFLLPGRSPAVPTVDCTILVGLRAGVFDSATPLFRFLHKERCGLGHRAA